MNQIITVQTSDPRKIGKCLVSNYPIAQHGESTVALGVTLFPGTARTNIMLRAANGRFLSYKTATPKVIADAVASLKPFPTPNQ